MKKFTWSLLILALAATSCAKDEVSSDAKPNPEQIGFYTNTTRSTVVNLPALEASTNGFVVYAASGAAPSAWFTGIDGTNNYKKTAGVWGWTGTAPSWPTISTGYPMNFYAYYASSYTGLTLNTPTPVPSSFYGTYIIQSEANQVDFLAASATAVSKPASGMIPLTFKHILSKINFGVIPGSGASVFVQSINVNNVGNLRSYDFLVGNWTAPQPITFASNYSYKTTANPATQLTGIDPTEAAVQNVVPSNGGNLMLMPQTATTWTPTTGIAAANAFMGVIYRLTTAADPNAVGYTVANNHPNYSSLTTPIQAALNGKPLFVKVGYPFAPSTMTWDKGKGYTYNICLGTSNATNGYVVDNFYYDETGAITTLPIIGKSKGDPISNGKINFIVNVGDWDDTTPPTVVQ